MTDKNDTLDKFVAALGDSYRSPAKEPNDLINEAVRAITCHHNGGTFEQSRAERDLEYLKVLALLNIANELQKLNKFGLVLEKP